MSTQHGNEPTWYHATVTEDDVPAITAPEPEGPNRRMMAVAAGLIVVILCSIGVSVSALRSDEGDRPEAETADAGFDADGESAALRLDEDAAEESDEAAALEQAEEDVDDESIAAPRPRPSTGSTPTKPTAPKPSTPTPKPTTTTAPTTPPTTKPPTTTTTAAPKPTVDSVTAPSTYACSEAPHFDDPGTLTLSWSTTGAESVAVAIDSPSGIYMDNLPEDGSLTVPAPCKPDSNTYYVIATGPGGTTATLQTTTTGV